MDSQRFDALARSLATPGSRRRLLGGLLVGSLPPLTAVARRNDDSGRGPEPAKCLTIGKRCSQASAESDGPGRGKGKAKGKKGKHHLPSCSTCCSRFGAPGPDGKARCACKGEGVACDNPSQCCGGLCRNGACTGCPGALTSCDGNCVDLQTDADHCGDCATSCANGQHCLNGQCVCDGTSCPRGCCAKDGSCQRGTDDQACGVNGANCQTCETCHACDGTTCVDVEATCCGDAAVCQGGTCVACGDGQRCRDGQCVCDPTSCPHGCCGGSDGVICQRGTSDQACGIGGAACQTCGTCLTCSGNQCIGAIDTCCGDKAVCQGGTCVACGDGQRCLNGQCVCDPTSCPRGCCAGATCNGGTDDAACGQGGGSCVDCTRTRQVCHDQACCTPVCAGKCAGASDGCGGTCPDNSGCSGCCDGNGQCQTDQSAKACGVGGVTCMPCPIDKPTCDQGVCVCPSGIACPQSGCCANSSDVCNAGACCTPDALATTCGARRCVTMQNNCGHSVACPCTVFTTSKKFTGALGGLTGADAQCQALATAAKLSGTYLAWLSDDTGSPASRFSQWPGPYQLVDGTVVANDWTDLTDGSLQNAINRDEAGNILPTDPSSEILVWTSTTTTGQLRDGASDCDDWADASINFTGDLGGDTDTNSSWTEGVKLSFCFADRRLYCFQQP